MSTAIYQEPSSEQPYRVPEEFLEFPAADELGRIDRDDAAPLLDGMLRRLARQEALCRRALGRLAARFLEVRGHRELCFARVSDYARERLGLSSRELQSMASVSRRLDELPELARAFEAGALNWTKLRAIAAVATADTAARWLEVAGESTSRELRERVKAWRAEQTDPLPVPAQQDLEETDEALIDGEPRVTVHVYCPRRTRSLWRSVAELASRVSGRPLSRWEALEAVVAEAASSMDFVAAGGAATGVGAENSMYAADGVVVPSRASSRAVRHADRSSELADEIVDEMAGLAALRRRCDPTPPKAGAPTDIERLAGTDEQLEALTARELDARMRAAIRAMQAVDWQMGCLLHTFSALRLHRALGFAGLGDYLAERLGISERKARGLIAVDRKSMLCGGELARAYRAGRLSWIRALSLLPVISEQHAQAWVRRAGEVTVRRLIDEVHWAEEVRDRGAFWLPVAPPELGAVLDCSDAGVELQMGAHFDAEAIATIRSEAPDAVTKLSFTGPASVIALFRDLLRSVQQVGGDAGSAGEWRPAWEGLERLLLHARDTWLALPRHRDPVHERDGWRCRVPACSSRRHLEDHHVIYRSRSGSHARGNRVSICAWHHRGAIHAGILRAYGDAEKEITWQLAASRGGVPWLELKNDVYVEA